MKTATRLLALPLIYLCGWWSFNQWLWRYFSGSDFDDRGRFANLFGWNDPEMELHWMRFWARVIPSRKFNWPKDYVGTKGNWFHAAKNVLVEWTRLTAERSGKFSAWLIVSLALTNACTLTLLMLA